MTLFFINRIRYFDYKLFFMFLGDWIALPREWLLVSFKSHYEMLMKDSVTKIFLLPVFFLD